MQVQKLLDEVVEEAQAIVKNRRQRRVEAALARKAARKNRRRKACETKKRPAERVD